MTSGHLWELFARLQGEIERLIAVANQCTVVNLKLRHLNRRALDVIRVNIVKAVTLSGPIPRWMGEVEDKSTLTLHQHVRVPTDHAVLGAAAGCTENILGLACPMLGVG